MKDTRARVLQPGFLALTLLLANCASPSQNTGGIQGQVANARFWPKEASAFARTTDEQKQCIQTANTFFLVNDETKIVFMNDGQFYLNELKRPCIGARISGVTQPVSGSPGLSSYGRRQICAGSVLTVSDRPGANPNAQCHLGDFLPISPLFEEKKEAHSRGS